MKKYAKYYKECIGIDYNGKKTYREGIVIESGGEQKLLDIEKLEDEIGIDLVTLFKALKNGEFYSKHPETGEVSWILLPQLYYCTRKWLIGCNSMIWNKQENCRDSWDCDPKDYGKTWALTREELSKEEREKYE